MRSETRERKKKKETRRVREIYRTYRAGKPGGSVVKNPPAHAGDVGDVSWQKKKKVCMT